MTVTHRSQVESEMCERKRLNCKTTWLERGEVISELGGA